MNVSELDRCKASSRLATAYSRDELGCLHSRDCRSRDAGNIDGGLDFAGADASRGTTCGEYGVKISTTAATSVFIIREAQ